MAAAIVSRGFIRNWYKPEIIPLCGIVGVAVTGACWILGHSAKGPDVIWDRKNNPTPWNNVEEGTQVKLLTVNQKFDK
ncbi:8270_t:CDS:2, partial [Acaulospora morrowiae]